ncbi:CRISPR system precrRNA processing endoribonuclease RAMP protein Cas6 [Microbispora rosea]|uniref:CRISPR system precrRNA processing endoribonuclease RAMP protein Cas6 n=1 Tax=Microbispora rosea TaxID=58117 RepID=UPI00369BD37A
MRQAHGLACRLFEGEAADHKAQVKHFTLWPPAADPEDPAGMLFRFAWLGDASPPLNLAELDKVRLGNVTCIVQKADLHTRSYPELAAPSSATAATLTFHSPTYFSRDGRAEILPDPRLMLAGCHRRWNASISGTSPVRIADELARETIRSVCLRDYDLRTMHMDSGYQKDRPGFIGTVELSLPRDAPVVIRTTFATLIRYVAYCGTGAQTTHGYGATSTVLEQE